VESTDPPAGRRRSAPRRFAGSFADLLMPSEDASRAIYGLILIGALLAAESGSVMRGMISDLALIRGAAIPLVALALAALLGATEETAVTIAVWSAVVSLALLELLAGLRAGASRGELALETGIGLAMGLGILSLKAVLH
jgi:hypothetical protein